MITAINIETAMLLFLISSNSSILLVNQVKPNALRFMPPLVIGSEEVDEALAILDSVLAGINQ